MLVERIVNNLSIKSNSVKLIFGSALSSILVALGFILFAQILSFTLNPGIAASFGAIAAAIYGIKIHRNAERPAR